MKSNIQQISIKDYRSEKGKIYPEFKLSFQVFGQPMHTAPVIMINHALTGNSNIAGENGWWKTVIGSNKVIDTKRFSIICFNIPGNEYHATDSCPDAGEISAADIATLYGQAIQQLGIERIHSLIGPSLGGGIAWELCIQYPELIQQLLIIASDHTCSPWVKAFNHIQLDILKNSNQALADARKMAMLFYRTANSINEKFIQHPKGIDACDWLDYHGNVLKERFSFSAYKSMTLLLNSVNLSKGNDLENSFQKIQAKVALVAIDSDLLFPIDSCKKTYHSLLNAGVQSSFHTIKSEHGHDAFLIEYQQMEQILQKHINYQAQTVSVLN